MHPPCSSSCYQQPKYHIQHTCVCVCVRTCECIWMDDKYFCKDHAHSISIHSRTSTLRPSAYNYPQWRGIDSKIHEVILIQRIPDPWRQSWSFGFTPFPCLFPEVMCFPETPYAWVELIYSQGHKAEQSQQTLTWTRQRGKQDGHVPTPSFQVDRG